MGDSSRMSTSTESPRTDPDAESAAATQWASVLLHQRRTTLPKRLQGPGPDPAQQAEILAAASAAPDHGQLLPWRFIEVPQSQRARLAEVFAAALLERDGAASEPALEQAREKAYRAPWLLLAVARLRGDDPAIPPSERLLSTGCAIQNMLLLATAMGLGSGLTSGKALQSEGLRRLFGLQPDEDALCFINIGHVGQARKARERPPVSAYFTRLGESVGGCDASLS